MSPGANDLDKAIGDLTIIAFYYLLRVGEYTIKNKRNNTKQTVQFRIKDITFFKRDSLGALSQISRQADSSLILSADSATLCLENQKNGWKGVCVHQESNGELLACPVHALGRRFVHIHHHTSNQDTTQSAYFSQGTRFDVNDNDIRASLKQAARILDYHSTRGIPVDCVDTHSLRCGGANALLLSGFSDRHIQKMGRWRSATFLEYIRENLSCFSSGMSRKMKTKFNFVNVTGGSYVDITHQVVHMPYTILPTAA
jgi:hypothetical protein